MDDLDRAQLMAFAVNKPDELDRRRKELRAKLRHDIAAPPKQDFTFEEMQSAANYMMSVTGKSKPMPS
jgi:hypothetical protein